MSDQKSERQSRPRKPTHMRRSRFGHPSVTRRLASEDYLAVLSFRSLADRIAVIYDLRGTGFHVFQTAAEALPRAICRTLGKSITHLVKKKVMTAPPISEPIVKHLLFALIPASFPDALPDGQIAFKTDLKHYKPDMGVPDLRT
jgi:hypothetical protein